MLCIAGHMMHHGRRDMALWTVMTFSTYLRPGEARGLLTCDLVPPAPSASLEMKQWVLILAPWERQQATKTGQYDETVSLDDSRFLFLGDLLGEHAAQQKLKRGVKDPDVPVEMWDFSGTTLRRAWHTAVQELKLDFAVECLYQLRHGGASRDQLLRLRSTGEVQRRGRWATPNTLKIYGKPGRLQQILSKTPKSLLQYAKLLKERFPIFFRSGVCPAPPRQ